MKCKSCKMNLSHSWKSCPNCGAPADPKAAQNAMEASPEHAPEMHLIAQSSFPSEFPQAILNSDSMHSLVSHLDWSKPGKVQPLPQQDSLRSLLEQLP